MSTKAQPVRAFIRVISWQIKGVTGSTRALPVRPSFGQRGFILTVGQKRDPNG